MRYSEVERLISLSVAASSPRSRMTLCRHAVGTLTRIDDFDALATLEFTPDAAAAFRAASVAPEAASNEQLTQWIARIDAGTLSDGDMDLALVRALTALESWRDFLRAAAARADTDGQHGTDELAVAMAIALLERVDEEIGGADIDDFLADPRMLTEFEGIRTMLTSDSVRP